MKILSIFGTRPEAIKLAPIVKALSLDDVVEAKVCVSGQHKEMLKQPLELFEITPDYDLAIMKPNQSLAELTAAILTNLSPILKSFKPDCLIVQGDTTTCFTAALTAYYQKIKVAHVEAGLRTHNLYSPWPEEGNRALVSKIAHWHFPPTELAKQNLLKEHIPEDKILVTGNTVIDALLMVLNKIHQDSLLQNTLQNKFAYLNPTKKLILVTGHRRENFGLGFENICKAISTLAREFDIEVVYPVHLNPNVQTPVNRLLADHHNIHLIEPLDYLSFVYLLERAHIVLTDSGGIQEEAPTLGKPVILMREVTERPEGVTAGTAKLVGTNYDIIVKTASELLTDNHAYQKMSAVHNPYGDGKATQRIITRILSA